MQEDRVILRISAKRTRILTVLWIATTILLYFVIPSIIELPIIIGAILIVVEGTISNKSHAASASVMTAKSRIIVIVLVTTIVCIVLPFAYWRSKDSGFVLPYNCLLAMALMLIFWQIVTLPGKSPLKSAAIVLVEIILLSTVARWLVFSSYPSIVGMDPWYHFPAVQRVIESGHPELDGQYAIFPLAHVFMAQTSLITGFPPKIAGFLSIGVAEAAIPVFICLATRKTIGERESLLTAALLSIWPLNMQLGWWIIPMAFGGALASVAWTCVVPLSNTLRIRKFTVLAVCFVAAVLTHPISSLAFVLALSFAFFYVSISSKVKTARLNRAAPAEKIVLNLGMCLGFSAAVLVAYWFIATQWSVNFMAGWFTLSEAMPIDISSGTFSRTNLNRLWDRIPTMAIVVAVVWAAAMSRSRYEDKERNLSRNALVGAAVGIGSITAVLSLFGVSEAIPERWSFFLEMLGLFAVACLLTRLYWDHSSIRRATAALLLSVVVLASTSNVYANLEPVFPGQQKTVPALDANEIVSSQWGSNHASVISTDVFFMNQFQGVNGNTQILDASRTLVLDERWQGMLVSREKTLNSPFNAVLKNTTIAAIASESLAEFMDAHNRVYDSNAVRCYVW